MFNNETPVIVKGYCGYIEEYEMHNIGFDSPICNITLRDTRDPRIKIVMEDIRLDEVQQNPLP